MCVQSVPLHIHDCIDTTSFSVEIKFTYGKVLRC